MVDIFGLERVMTWVFFIHIISSLNHLNDVNNDKSKLFSITSHIIFNLAYYLLYNNMDLSKRK